MEAKLKPLAEQVIVLTGASSGIGLCTAQLAAQQGARLVLIASSTRMLETLVSIIGASGGEAICIAADVAVREEAAAAARSAAAHFGRIDTWINNAGASIYGRLDQVTEDESRRVFDVNFWGVVNGSLAALPYLLGGGALINVGSELLARDLPLQGMYSSSKHAVKGFTRALRAEVIDVDHAPVAIALIQCGVSEPPNPSFGEDPAYLPDGAQAALDPMLIAESILRVATEGTREMRASQRPSSRPRPGPAAIAPVARPTVKHA
jgi:NADP-dependent 3-hydroxy acid dehydrogenase YdfG